MYWQDKLKWVIIQRYGHKNHTYYPFDDINIKHFDPNKFIIDAKSYKNLLIYYIGYMMMKNLECQILYALLSIRWLDTSKKLMIISI